MSAEEGSANEIVEAADNRVDPALLLLAHLLAERQPAHRLLISAGGLVISGEVVSPQGWRQAVKELDAELQEILADAVETNQVQAMESPRLIYLRERLRWGSGLTLAQAKELRSAQAAAARRQRFLHLVNVTLVTASGEISVARWRLPLEKVDGFNLVSAATSADQGRKVRDP